MIDQSRCMAQRDGEPLGGARCQAPATHLSYLGRRCVRHAEELRRSLRNANTLGNILSGGVPSEEKIARLVVELPS
jgi:hypothetical protein